MDPNSSLTCSLSRYSDPLQLGSSVQALCSAAAQRQANACERAGTSKKGERERQRTKEKKAKESLNGRMIAISLALYFSSFHLTLPLSTATSTVLVPLRLEQTPLSPLDPPALCPWALPIHAPEEKRKISSSYPSRSHYHY